MGTRVAGAAVPTPGRPLRGVTVSGVRFLPLWPVFLLGVCVAVVAVYSLLRLQADNDRSHRMETLLAQFEGAVARQNGLSWEAITRRQTSAGFNEEMQARRLRASAILTALNEIEGESDWLATVADAYSSYTSSEERALALLRVGLDEPARRVQQEEVAPRFDAVRGLIADISAASSSDTAEMRRLTGAGSIATMIAAAFTIGFLLWRYERARGAVALSAAEEASLRASEEQFRTAFERSAIGVALIGLDGGFLQVNQALCTLLGYDEAELRRLTIDAITHPEDRSTERHLTAALIADTRATYEIEKRLYNRRGQVRWVFESVSLVRGPAGAPMHFIVQFQDVTDRKSLEQELVYQAYHDALTGLPNRVMFMDTLRKALDRARDGRAAVGVLFLDLDGFKMVNDSLGHATGDVLLKEVAHRLKGCLRPSDLVTRFGGDEFTVLVEEVADLTEVAAIAGRCLAALHPPFRVKSREMRISASIGISLRQPLVAAVPPDELLREADIALYRAKAEGKGRFAVFDPSMSATAVERLELVVDLQQAVARGDLTLHYQPEIDLRSERIVGAEALLRWQHPQRGLIYPNEFIPLAEETGLILSIGEWVLVEACHQAQAWQSLRPDGPPLVISVNLSVRQLVAAGVVELVARVLQETGLAPHSLRIEITESVLMEDADLSAATLHGLRALGVQLAIDDFGTGYSSLSYLRHFPVDAVKIDRSFAAEVTHDDGTAAIVRTVTELAHDLDMEVTAEGIEDADQLALVRFLQCDRAQGYYVAPPLPAGEVAHLLAGGTMIESAPAVAVGDEA
jgi:diguanylate cyclase (GGDEF)-like protein/PAS domain S-box-containing protein